VDRNDLFCLFRRVQPAFQAVIDGEVFRKQRIERRLNDLYPKVGLVHAVEVAPVFYPGQPVAEIILILFVQPGHMIDQVFSIEGDTGRVRDGKT